MSKEEHPIGQLALTVGDMAFATLEAVRTPEEWMNDDDTQVTITRSASDLTYLFLGLQTLVAYALEEEDEDPQHGLDTALHCAALGASLAAELAAAVQPAEQPTDEQELALNAT